MVNKGQAFELSGGRLCLDFANTLEKRSTARIELLESYTDLLSWSRQAGILSAEEERQLSKRARARPREAERALDRARRVREALFAVFSQGDGFALEALRGELSGAYRNPVLR
ncbi:MAG: ABATE domain-containing protein, partial [Vicinamibacteria bacterium]